MKSPIRSSFSPPVPSPSAGGERGASLCFAWQGVAISATLLFGTAAPSRAQLTPVGNHRIFQNLIGGAVEVGDHFGADLAGGDFNGDGFCDLAIGTPGEDLGPNADAGAVFVVYGSATGLNMGAQAPLLIHQDVEGVEGAAEPGDGFGSHLIAGDFTGDGNDELVVGIPSEDVGALVDAGAIQEFFGTPAGLTTLGDVLLTRGSFGSTSDLQGYRFGAALATGYVELLGDARLDLVVGVPGGALAPTINGAAVEVAGSPTGLDTAASAHVFPPASSGARAGAAVAVGDVDGDDLVGDLIIGAPFGELGGADNEGAVWIDPQGCCGYLPVPLAPGPESHMGTSIALGDFRGVGYDQMLLGAPDAEAFLVEDAGAVILYDEVEQTFAYITQDPLRFGFGTPDPMDHFGRELAVGDFDGDGFDDVAFGVPDEDLDAGGGGSIVNAGIVQVLYGSATGLRYDTNQFWRLAGPIGYFELPDDRFGAALAACDFDGDGADDLAIGAPGANSAGSDEAGIVQILYGFTPAIFGDDFESGDTTAWM